MRVDAESQHASGGIDKDRGRVGDAAGRLTLEGPVNQDANLKDWSKDGKRERCKVQADLVSVQDFSHRP